MRKPYLLFITLCALLAPLGARAGEMPWAKSLGEAMNQAKQTDKLVMIDFYADWCGWCKRLDADVYTDPGVIQAAKQVIPIKLNSEKDGLEAARHYGIYNLPTILFINKRGAEVGLISGYEDATRFTQELTNAVEHHRELPALEKQYRSKPGVQLAAQLTASYAREADQPKAVTMLAEVAKQDPSGVKGYLAESTLRVAGMYEESGRNAQAVPLFRSVLKLKSKPIERGLAHISLAECNLHQNKIDAAIPELKATLAMPDCPPQIQKAAQSYLGQIQQYKSRKH